MRGRRKERPNPDRVFRQTCNRAFGLCSVSLQACHDRLNHRKVGRDHLQIVQDGKCSPELRQAQQY
jgi:hypothetical protein